MSPKTENRSKTNIGRGERIASAIAGGTLAGLGVVLALKNRKSPWAGVGVALAGGSLVFRGASGHCAVKAALKSSEPIHIERTFTVTGKAPQEVYEFWRNLENLSKAMPGVEAVPGKDNRSHWKIKGPAGAPISWDAEIASERPGHVIEFRSVPGSVVQLSGIVRFKRKHGGGTKVHLSLRAITPGGAIGEALANAFCFRPEASVDAGLETLREALESA